MRMAYGFISLCLASSFMHLLHTYCSMYFISTLLSCAGCHNGVLILNFISSVGGSGRSVATNLILFFKRDNGNFICLV